MGHYFLYNDIQHIRIYMLDVLEVLSNFYVTLDVKMDKLTSWTIFLSIFVQLAYYESLLEHSVAGIGEPQKKFLFLVQRPLRGWGGVGGNGLATKKNNLFSSSKKISHKEMLPLSPRGVRP